MINDYSAVKGSIVHFVASVRGALGGRPTRAAVVIGVATPHVPPCYATHVAQHWIIKHECILLQDGMKSFVAYLSRGKRILDRRTITFSGNEPSTILWDTTVYNLLSFNQDR